MPRRSCGSNSPTTCLATPPAAPPTTGRLSPPACRGRPSGTSTASSAPVGSACCVVGRPRRGVLSGGDHGDGAVRWSLATSAGADHPAFRAPGRSGQTAAHAPSSRSICRWANDPLRAAGERRYRGVAARHEARRLSACWLPPRVQLGRRGRTGSAARAGGDTPGGRRQRLHRRDAPGAGRPRGCTAGVLRIQRGAVAAERRGARSSRRRGVRLSISNRDAQPAVVKLRDPSGRTAATVYVAPGSTAAVAELPDTAYRPDFAIGELWSRACNTFAAGMRVERFAVDVLPSDQSPLLIPPDLSVTPAPADIPDAEFEHE